MAVDPEQAEVKAAGGVVWRRGADGVEFAVAHRPRYDDWSLPKGKLDPVSYTHLTLPTTPYV